MRIISGQCISRIMEPPVLSSISQDRAGADHRSIVGHADDAFRILKAFRATRVRAQQSRLILAQQVFGRYSRENRSSASRQDARPDNSPVFHRSTYKSAMTSPRYDPRGRVMIWRRLQWRVPETGPTLPHSEGRALSGLEWAVADANLQPSRQHSKGPGDKARALKFTRNGAGI